MHPVRRLRTQVGITQETLARLAGTSQPTIAAYEAGQKSPTLDTLAKLAGALGLEASISFVPPLTREDRRSLAYHHAVTEKLKSAPLTVLAKARQNLKSLSRRHPDARSLLTSWRRWLDSPIDDLVRLCLDQGLFARDMRQVTPFAGLLSADERLKIIKKFRSEQHR